MQYVPREVAYMASKIDVTRNTFKLTTSGSTTARPSSIVTINLPEGASHVDLRSFKVFFNVATSVSAGTTFGKLHRMSDLIQTLEVYIGGVQVSAISDFNTVCRMYTLACTSRDREESIGTTLGGHQLKDVNGADAAYLCLALGSLPGFFGESATRFLSSQITGSISVRLTMAPAAVLAIRENGHAIGTDLSALDDAVEAGAKTITYECTDIEASIDTLNLGPDVDRMLMDRLSQDEFLPVNFLDYSVYNMLNQTGDHVVRFSLSSSSVETVLAGMRLSNYSNGGVRARAFQDASLTEKICPAYFYFESFNATGGNDRLKGKLTYQYSANGIKHPQFPGSVMDAAAHTVLMADKMDKYHSGNMITSLPHFQNGAAIFPLILGLPGQPLNVRHGYDSRGSNTSFELEFKEITVPDQGVAANPPSQRPASVSTVVAAQVKKQLRLASNRQIAVDH